MAINKKLIHFKEWNTFISNQGVNGNYTTPSTSATSTSPALYGQIKETSIVFIQDVQKIWTHGKLYDCSTPDLSAYLTAEDLATLNAFMNNSSVSKDGETLTVEINGSTQSLTNTWRSISDKTNGTSSTISASEKAVKAAYDLAASKTSNTGTVTSVAPGTGLTGTSSDTAITSSGTINLKTASSSEIGGIKIGYSESGKNYPVQLDSDYKAYVYVPWTDSNTDTKNTAGSSNKTGTKLLLVGATSTTTGTTYTNSNCYVGTDNCLYSGGTKVLTSHQDISGKQDKLTSGTNIKTVNSNSLLGSGNISVGTITKVQANGTDVASSGTANIPAASTSAYGVTKLSSSTSSTSTSLAATASAVKSAYDLANGKWTYNADTIKAVKVNNAVAADSASAVAWSGITSKPTTISGYGITDAYTKSAANGKFITGARDAYNVNALYDAGIHMVASGTNVPCGSEYGVCLTLPYRQLYNNSKPDFGAQIFLPNGDDNTKPNSLFFRTALGDAWNAWQEVATKGSLAAVATSGSYNDLSNKPTIPSAVTSSTVSGWGFTKNAGDITGVTAGNGLTGGATSGNATLNVGAGTGITVAADSVSVNLKDATALTINAAAATTTSGRVYPVAVDKSGYLAVNVPWKNDDTKSFTITASANDDDVVVLSGTNGTNATTYTASHAKTFGNTTAPYTAKYTSGNSTTSISGSGASATIKIPQLTVDAYGHVRAAADENVTITMPTVTTYSDATTTTSGLMSAADKSKLDSVPTSFAPTNAEANVQSDWNATSGDAFIKNKPSLSTVATSGSYNDLSDIPIIPAAYEGNYSTTTLTASLTSFTLNPNRYYTFTPSSASTRTFRFGSAVSGIVNEYIVEINMSSYAPTIAFPSSVVWANGSAPSYSVGKKYIISIVNNYAVFAEF